MNDEMERKFWNLHSRTNAYIDIAFDNYGFECVDEDQGYDYSVASRENLFSDFVLWMFLSDERFKEELENAGFSLDERARM